MAYDGQEDLWPAAPLSFNFNSNEASLTTTTCDYITMDTMNQWQVSAMEDVDIVSGMPQASGVSESSGVSEESLGNSHMGDTHANKPWCVSQPQYFMIRTHNLKASLMVSCYPSP